MRSNILYIVATPIGNLGDITLRALEVLAEADVIYCEDTRVTSKLLAAHNIKNELRKYNDFSDAGARSRILQQLETGKNIALVSDAGMPLISDPGYKLVVEAKAAGCEVSVVPGASSVTAALVLSGLPSDKFLFAGFVPPKKQDDFFSDLKNVQATLIFFESPKRVLKALQKMRALFGNRKAAVVREITKMFEEAKTDELDALIEYYSENEVKGEVVILVEGASDVSSDLDEEKVISVLAEKLSSKDAAELAAKILGKSKKEIYDRIIATSK